MVYYFGDLTRFDGSLWASEFFGGWYFNILETCIPFPL